MVRQVIPDYDERLEAWRQRNLDAARLWQSIALVVVFVVSVLGYLNLRWDRVEIVIITSAMVVWLGYNVYQESR